MNLTPFRVSCIPKPLTAPLGNDPHLQKVGNIYKKVDPFTLTNGIDPCRHSFGPIAPQLLLADRYRTYHT
ncbi:MAG: hypothetical protein ABI180_15805 [Microcoleus sp.]|jgi:hypothetical protein